MWECARSEAHPGITVHLTALNFFAFLIFFFKFGLGRGGSHSIAWGLRAQHVLLIPWTGTVLVIT